MRCEPWMNEVPKQRKSPLKIARENLSWCSDRVRKLNEELFEAERQFIAASEHLDKLEHKS